MKKLVVIFGLLGLVSLLCSVSFAATDYVITNDDNPSGNSATVFTVGSGGHLTQFTVLKTGYDGLGGGYFAWQGTAVTKSKTCVFVANTGSDNITAFTTAGKLVGSYGIPGMFSTYGLGGSITLDPVEGKLLVSGNSGLLDISTWLVGKTCALTHLADYTPSAGADYFSPVGVTPKDSYVVVPVPDYEAAELYSINHTNGVLTDIGNVNFYDDVTECQSYGCFPTGLDFTNDEKLVVFGNATLGSETGDSYLLSANITSTGLTNPADTVVTNSAGAINDNNPHFTATARGGSGDLIIGESGYDGYGPSGLVCANFTESPFSVSVVNAVAVTNADNYQGSVVTFGTEGFAAEYPNVIQSFSIGSGCSITLGPTTTDSQGYGLLSISAFPINQ